MNVFLLFGCSYAFLRLTYRSAHAIKRVSNLRTNEPGHIDARTMQYLTDRSIIFLRSRFGGYKYSALCHFPF
jgi:hypothetical protein